MKEILRFISNILGVGGIVAVISWGLSNRSEKRGRKISALQAQLKYLYGPLRFFTLQNEKCIEHTQKLSQAAQSAYKDQISSTNCDIQTRLDIDFSKLSQISNDYASLVLSNSEHIIKILIEGYSYIEPDDVDLFGEVVHDYNRNKIEGNKTASERMPLAVSMQLGQVILMRPEFNARVRERFDAKKEELDSYSK